MQNRPLIYEIPIKTIKFIGNSERVFYLCERIEKSVKRFGVQIFNCMMKSSLTCSRLIAILVVILFLFCSPKAGAQGFAIKTNLAYDAVAAANLGIEFGLAPRWTMDISGNYMPWKFYNGNLRKHAFVQPEARFWFCDRFSGHFLGIHGHAGIYNVADSGVLGKISTSYLDFSKLDGRRYEGWFAGAGISYGYAVILGKHWNMEFEIGGGYAYFVSDVYECEKCGSKLEDDVPHHYFGVTKAAINLVYVF